MAEVSRKCRGFRGGTKEQGESNMKKLTKELMRLESWLVPGLHQKELGGEEVTAPSDQVLKDYIANHTDRVRFFYRGPYHQRVKVILEKAMERLTAESIRINEAKIAALQPDNPFYRQQKDAQ